MLYDILSFVPFILLPLLLPLLIILLVFIIIPRRISY